MTVFVAEKRDITRRRNVAKREDEGGNFCHFGARLQRLEGMLWGVPGFAPSLELREAVAPGAGLEESLSLKVRVSAFLHFPFAFARVARACVRGMLIGP